MEPREVNADLGVSIVLQGGSEDQELLQAASRGDYGAVRRILLATPYQLDPKLVDRIVEDLTIGRALP
jgi:hypothetical protein